MTMVSGRTPYAAIASALAGEPGISCSFFDIGGLDEDPPPGWRIPGLRFT
jgi:hypothetical protein